jgi:hypothetical protein
VSTLRWRSFVAGLKRGDVGISPKLDRLFRSALDALQVIEDLRPPADRPQDSHEGVAGVLKARGTLAWSSRRIAET